MTTLIKNGFVYDGSGRVPAQTDILMSGENIVRIGTGMQKCDTVIDATNTIVTPGFIDINTVSDHFYTIFTEPFCEGFVRDGVTTIIGGNCGTSLAPIAHGLNAPINTNWHSVKEFLKILAKQKCGINFGTFVGHTTIRESILKNQCCDLTDTEMKTLTEIIAQSFDEGAFGVSVDFDNRCSAQTPLYELKKIAEISAQKKKIFAIHPRDTKENAISAIEEIIDIAHTTKANIEISALQPLAQFKKEYQKIKQIIEKNAATEHIHIDCSPFLDQPIPIDMFLPEWARQGDIETMLGYIYDKHLEKRLLEHFKHIAIEFLTIGTVPHALTFLSGTSMKTFAEHFHLRSPHAILELMKLSHLNATLFYKNGDEKLLKEYLTSPYTIIASHWAHFPHPVNNNGLQNITKSTMQKFLTKVKEEIDMPLEQAIQKITSLPAQKYGIEKRGQIKEGYYADIVIMKENKVSDVLVNGEVTLREGILIRKLNGIILKSKYE